MPWTRRQVKYLLSNGSPLSSGQKQKMVGELHANPAMGHMKKGSKALSSAAASRVRKKASRMIGY
jgi:hypothetical protein